MDRQPSIIRNALALTAVNLLMRLVSIAFHAWLSGRIAAAGLGLVQLVMSAGSLAITLGLGGARVGAMYLAAESFGRGDRDALRRVMTGCALHTLGVSALCACALFLLAPALSVRMNAGVPCTGALRLLALTLPVTCLNLVLSGYFTASGQLRTLVAVNALDRLTSLALTFLLLARPGLSSARACEAIVLGGGLSDLLATAVMIVLFCRRCGAPRRLPEARLFRRVTRVCLPLWAADALRAGLGTLEQFLIPWGLGRAAGGGQAALAAYGTISGMVFPILMFPSSLLYALADLLVPELAQISARRDSALLGTRAEAALQTAAVYACFSAGAVFTLARPLASLLYKSAQAASLLRVFSFMIPVLYLDAVTDGMHKGLGQQAACVRYNTVTAVLDAALLRLLLPRMGLAGYVLTFCLTHALNFFLSIRRLLRVTHLTLSTRLFPRALAASAGACALSCGAGPDGAALALHAAVYTAAFALLLYLTGADVRGAAERLTCRSAGGTMKKRHAKEADAWNASNTPSRPFGTAGRGF